MAKKVNNKKAKPSVAFYDLAGCQGCVLSFIFNEDELLDLLDHVDVKAFRFVKGAKDDKQIDIAFVEGLVASNDDLENLNRIREKSKILVAMGACACTGCIPAYRNFMDTSKYAYLVYEKTKEIKDVPATPINEHVVVDYYIQGCPPDKKHISSFIKDVLLGKNPYDYDKPVCYECKLNENRCLLDEGKMCFGPITRGGCDSVCTNGKFECWGCRGPTPDADIPLMIKTLEQKGFPKDHIRQRLRTFAGMQMEKPTLKTVKPKKIKKKKKLVKKKIKPKPKPAPKKIVKKKKVKKKVAKKKKAVKKKAKKKKTVKKSVKKAKKKKDVKKKSTKKKTAKKKTVVKKKTAKKKTVVKKKTAKKKVVKKQVVKKKSVKKKVPAKKSFVGLLKGKLKKR